MRFMDDDTDDGEELDDDDELPECVLCSDEATVVRHGVWESVYLCDECAANTEGVDAEELAHAYDD